DLGLRGWLVRRRRGRSFLRAHRDLYRLSPRGRPLGRLSRRKLRLTPLPARPAIQPGVTGVRSPMLLNARERHMTDHDQTDPSTWDPALDAVAAAPRHHKVLFENDNLRVLEVTLEPNDEEPVHHHRWPSVFVFDS